MDILVECLPRAGAVLTVVLGLIGFFKPGLITYAQQITLGSPMALSEARVVFGGLHLGAGITALVLHEPVIYLTLGVAWSFGLLARFYSMVADKTGLQQSLPGITSTLRPMAVFCTSSRRKMVSACGACILASATAPAVFFPAPSHCRIFSSIRTMPRICPALLFRHPQFPIKPSSSGRKRASCTSSRIQARAVTRDRSGMTHCGCAASTCTGAAKSR